MRIAAYVAYAIVSIPGVVAGGRKGVVAIEGVFVPCRAYPNLQQPAQRR